MFLMNILGRELQTSQTTAVLAPMAQYEVDTWAEINLRTKRFRKQATDINLVHFTTTWVGLLP